MLVHVSNTGTGQRHLGTRNKGGQLMVIAVAEHYRGTDATVCVDDSFGTQDDRTRVGVARVHLPEYGRLQSIATVIRNRLQRFEHGYAAHRRDLYLNAAGYAYGDGWGRKRIQKLRKWNQQAYRDRCPSVLLPQAFGPFHQADHAALFAASVQHVQQIYARDRASLQYVHEALGADPRVHLAPDFTIAVKGRAPEGWADTDPGDRLLLVPNCRMVDKLGEEAAKKYLQMLVDIVKQAPQLGLRPIFVIHSNEDAALAHRLIKDHDLQVALITSDCPLELKGILAHGRLALASRFHSVVSALCGCTPTLVVGWSHKYAELLSDFDQPSFLLDAETSSGAVIERIKQEAEASRQAEIKQQLQQSHQRLLNQVQSMWQQVDSLLPHYPQALPAASSHAA